MWSDYENRVFDTRFIAQNRVFKTRDVSKIYTFETMPTNYIVRKLGLIPNFGPRFPCSDVDDMVFIQMESTYNSTLRGSIS